MTRLRSRLRRLALADLPRRTRVLFRGSEADARALREGGPEAARVCARLGVDPDDVDRSRVAVWPGRRGLLYVPSPPRPGASTIVVCGVAVTF